MLLRPGSACRFGLRLRLGRLQACVWKSIPSSEWAFRDGTDGGAALDVPKTEVADCHHAEGIYAATEVTRRILAEALAEKVGRGELPEDHALRICRQIMRENALELFPQLRHRLWRKSADRPAPTG